jgi:glycosyltransferase involved in cell wall biosynthesis
MASPKITAIIIFLNGETFLAEAIESVISQTCPDWELLLCDDGSTDKATVIAKQYASQFPDKIRYLEHPNHENRGMSATRMLGVSQSLGEYVAMLDADDIWTPRKLEEQLAILEKHPQVAMVYGPMKLWYSWTGRAQDDRRDFLQPMGVQPDSIVQPPELLLSFLTDPMHHPSGLLTRKSVLLEVGGYESAFRGEYEDVVVQSKISLRHPVYASGACWYWYRQHEGSCTAATRRNWEEKPVRKIYLDRFEAYLREKNVTSGPVWDEVQRQLRPFRRKSAYRVSRITRQMKLLGRAAAKRVLPLPALTWLRAKWWKGPYSPPVGWVTFGIEQFLGRHRSDLRGRVLEFGQPTYTRQFGTRELTQSDVMQPTRGNPLATIVGDLQTGENVPESAFDCIVLTHVLHVLYDFRAGLAHAVEALKPGGVLLATVPCISQISRFDQVRWGDYWRFTSRSVERLFAEFFPDEAVEVQVFGNALAATAFLQGLVSEELSAAELDAKDEEYEMVIAIRAVKAASAAATASSVRSPRVAQVHAELAG